MADERRDRALLLALELRIFRTASEDIPRLIEVLKRILA